LSTTSGDMTLGAITSNATNGVAVNLTSNGSIVGNGDATTNVAATGTGALLNMTAANNIGNANLPLTVNSAIGTGTATTGGIWLSDLFTATPSGLSAPKGVVYLVSPP